MFHFIDMYKPEFSLQNEVMEGAISNGTVVRCNVNGGFTVNEAILKLA